MNGLISPTTWALLVVLIGLAVLIALTVVQRRREVVGPVREVHALSGLRDQLKRAAESGKPLHIALGGGGLGSVKTASSLAGLQLLEGLSDAAVSYDVAPIVTVGDPTLLPLAQDILRRAYERNQVPELYDPTRVRFVAPSALAYGGAAVPVGVPEQVTSHVLIGAFGPEGSLLADSGYQQEAVVGAAVDTLEAIAALYPATEQLAMGEELYAAGSQVTDEGKYATSLMAHDIVRFTLVAAILLGALAALVAG